MYKGIILYCMTTCVRVCVCACVCVCVCVTPEKSTSERAYVDQQADARRFRHVDSPTSPASGSSKYSEQNGRTTKV